VPAPTTQTKTAPASQPSSPTPTPVVDGHDQLNISNAVLLGPHKNVRVMDAAVTHILYSCNKDGDVVHLSYDTLNWPSNTGGNGKTVDGSVFIFWKSGGLVVGGLFDWHGKGQTNKTLQNVDAGYLDGQVPPAGAPIWFCIVSLDEKQRTNVAQSQTNW